MVKRSIFFVKHCIKKLLFGADYGVDANTKEFKRQNVVFSDKMYINGNIFIINNGSIEIGEGFQANSGIEFNPIGGDVILRLISFTKESRIIIGKNVGISNSTLLAWEKIEIGNNVMIGGGVKIWDTNFHSLDPLIRTNGVYDYDVKSSPVKIDDYAFIGAGSIILKGVHIGKNAIIAAGSVVVKSIPDNAIAGGNPCKVIRYIEQNIK